MFKRNKALNVRITPEVHRKAKIKSAETGISLSQAVDELLDKWTKKEKQKDKNK